MILKTGKGYFIKDGKKISKFDLPIGEHPNPIGCTVIEVGSQSELDNIVLDKSEKQIKIEEKFSTMQALKMSGKVKIQKITGLTDDEFNALFGV